MGKCIFPYFFAHSPICPFWGKKMENTKFSHDFPSVHKCQHDYFTIWRTMPPDITNIFYEKHENHVIVNIINKWITWESSQHVRVDFVILTYWHHPESSYLMGMEGICNLSTLPWNQRPMIYDGIRQAIWTSSRLKNIFVCITNSAIEKLANDMAKLFNFFLLKICMILKKLRH